MLRRAALLLAAAVLLSAAQCGTDTDQPDPDPAPTSEAVPSPPPSPSPAEPTEEAEALDPQFGTCAEAVAAGYGPYTRGEDPEYDWYRDGDGDGVVCE